MVVTRYIVAFLRSDSQCVHVIYMHVIYKTLIVVESQVDQPRCGGQKTTYCPFAQVHPPGTSQ